MKNQYFGDKRDYFKYGLLEALTTEIDGVKQLTCIWMLTPPAANKDGSKMFVPHPDNGRLSLFFEACRVNGIADVTEMRRYFRDRPFRFFPYGDTRDLYLTTQNRSRYFRDIPDGALRDSVVFFDPDNGLEPVVKATTAHLRYVELADVFGKMDKTSIAVIYQHRPRVQASRFWSQVASALRQRLRTTVAYIAESDVAFFVVPRDRSRIPPILSVLNKQARLVAPGNRTRDINRTT